MIDWATLFDFFVVFAFGAMVGMGELISRYRDEPWGTIKSPPGIGYVLLNALVSVAALLLIRGFEWTFSVQEDAIRWTQVLVAGFGAMALFRSSLFNVRVGDKDIAVGPNSFLQIVLSATDREVDRLRATIRASLIKEIMADVSFEKAKVPLPLSCIALMQNMPPAEQAELNEDVSKLDATDKVSEEVKSYLLGVALLNYVGDEVLQAAVKLLDDQIQVSKEERNLDTSLPSE
jgi:hypothetical protein